MEAGLTTSESVTKQFQTMGAKPVIPPKQRAVLHEDNCMKNRNQNIKHMKKAGLDRKRSGYHKRSFGVTAFYGLRTVFSDKLKIQSSCSILWCVRHDSDKVRH